MIAEDELVAEMLSIDVTDPPELDVFTLVKAVIADNVSAVVVVAEQTTVPFAALEHLPGAKQ